ncbi:MAG: SH3 domain-containing protein [Lachnospiraceae bacterium]|jgi:cell wall-associated NlpC family hydrolase|nr:SH3 domain-containing protein [Lachnospiraceae bacterium]MCI8871891.1 SH3 domain-containing protein [Lachnospiraceae bacterium]GFI31037.1 putative endopeptidase p60 [Lachnospiraceae bacterium]
MKKSEFRRVIAACMTGAVVFGAVQMPVKAAGNMEAGVTAMLSQSLTAETDGAAEEPAAPATVCGYTNLGIAQVENHLNIREGAGEEYDLVGKLPVDAGCEILSQEGEWFQIQSGKVTGYVKGEYLLTGQEAAARADEVKSIVATSVTQTLNARVEPNTDCSIWTMIAEGEELQMIEDQGDWLKVDVDGDECYVAREFVELSEQLPKAMTMTEIRYGEGISDVRVDMVQYACQFVGNRYVWGGTSLTNGVDCSGFTMKIYEKYGIYLPHSSSAQSGYGTRINPNEAKPGDLFFYGNGGGINHVAMYIGNGQVVHASSARTGIKISNAFYRSPICVTRLISD